MRLLLLNFILIFMLGGCSQSPITDDPKGSEEPTMEEFDFIVSQDGTGDFKSLQEAFEAVPAYKEDRTVIYIKDGVYKEVHKLPENKTNVTIVGESASGVILTYDNYASKINPDTGEEYGTSGSASNYIYGDGFVAFNVTFQNMAGPVGQALAIYIESDKAVFVNCRFIGNQDTMYGGRSRQYFKNCYIEGTTDFIFGPATAFFDNCELFTKGGSAITAASTEPYVDYGYVFKNCSISGTGRHITTLGRPWRPHAAVAFLNCEMSECIKPTGWDNWGDPDNEATARYVEYNNTGVGAAPSQRVDWVKMLTESEAEKFTIENVFKTAYSDTPVPVIDNWDPRKVIAKTNAFLESVEY